MDRDILLTIAIPAYNMERYLSRCLDSLLVADIMSKVQVIIVNDGSKDKTLDIAYDYRNRFPEFFQVINKENGNYGSCMNVSLAQARGKYFRTLDADDWYDQAALIKYLDNLSYSDADMIVSEYYKYDEPSNSKSLISFELSNIDLNRDLEINSSFWENKSVLDHIHVYCVSYKTEVLRASGIRWPEKVFYTDNVYLYWPLKIIKTIRFIPHPVYVYLIGRDEQSVSLASLKKNHHSYDVVTNAVLDDYINSEIDNQIKPLAHYILLKLLCRFYNTLLYNGLKEKDSVDRLDQKLKSYQVLYSESGKVSDYRGNFFIEYYRSKRLCFFLLRFDYLIRSCKILRWFFNA